MAVACTCISLCLNILERYMKTLVYASTACLISFCTAVWVSFQREMVLLRLWMSFTTWFGLLLHKPFPHVSTMPSSPQLSVSACILPAHANNHFPSISFPICWVKQFYDLGMGLFILLSDLTQACWAWQKNPLNIIIRKKKNLQNVIFRADSL